MGELGGHVVDGRKVSAAVGPFVKKLFVTGRDGELSSRGPDDVTVVKGEMADLPHDRRQSVGTMGSFFAADVFQSSLYTVEAAIQLATCHVTIVRSQAIQPPHSPLRKCASMPLVVTTGVLERSSGCDLNVP